LLKLNQPAKVWPLFRHSPDPRVRSYLIHLLSPFAADPAIIVQRLDDESDITSRRALLLALGEFNEEGPSSVNRKFLLPKVQEIYQTATDAGLHAAAEWLLRTWKQEAWLKQVNATWAQDKEQQRQKQLSLAQDPSPLPHWYVNGQGQMMVVIRGPVEFVMGSPVTEPDREDDEVEHKLRIERTFALAAKPVTFEQFREHQPDFKEKLPDHYAKEADLPFIRLIWSTAAKYCNWLSEVEGIPETERCYELQGDKITPKANHLNLSGYRLPMEAEMEYAIRAGAVTSRHFGQTSTLLAKYGWYERNSLERTWPAGMLKPNDFGLFDLHGNVSTWCEDQYKYYGSDAIIKDDLRVVRGGGYGMFATHVRSANRDIAGENHPSDYIGIRVARTMPPRGP
jgi:formylglycine-generating enzyme required for sulfatase activity